MPALDEKPIDFSRLPRLAPRDGSYEAMLARRAAQPQKQPPQTIAFPGILRSRTRYYATAVAALLVAVLGLAIWYPPENNTPATNTTLAALSSSAAHSSAALSSVPASMVPAASTEATTAQTQEAKPSSQTTTSAQAILTEAVEWYDGLGEGSSNEPLVVADAIFESF